MSTAALRLQPTTVPPGPSLPRRPQLRVLEGGRAPAVRARQATFRRRRAVAVAVLAGLVVGLLLLANAAVAGIAGGGAPSAATGASSPAYRVVQPGDTLWTIAAAVAPEVDVRITVERLAELNGRAPLVAGQRLELPA